MNKADCFVLGKLTKPHGYKGAMVLFIDADEPQAYEALDAVWVEVGDRLVPHFIDALRPHNTADKYVVELEGVDNEAKAKAIAGMHGIPAHQHAPESRRQHLLPA